MAISTASRALFLNTALKPGFWNGDVPPSQFLDPVNFTKFEITGQKQDFKKLPSMMDGSVGETLASVPNPTDAAKVTAEANYMPPDMLSLLLGADISEVTTTQSTVTDELVTTALGFWIPLGNQNITAFSLKTGAGVAVDAAKFAVDTTNGLIKALHADAVGVGMQASYTKSARSSELYRSGKAKSAYVQFLGTGTEKVSGRKSLIRVWKCSLAATDAFDLVGNDYLNGAIEGDMLTPPDKSSPWEFELL